MIRKLNYEDIDNVAKIHGGELEGFLSQLGEGFLKKFYKASLNIPELFTLVEYSEGKILGFVSATTSTDGLYKKIIFTDILGFTISLLSYFIVHPGKALVMMKIFSYPGFGKDNAELLTIAVDKKFQKIGFGKNLFEAAAGEYKKRGINRFRISVYERLGANKFYIKIGCKKERSFEFLGEKMNYYSYEV